MPQITRAKAGLDGTTVQSVPALEYSGVVIHSREAMLCLTDMWKAEGSDPSRRPSEWARSADARRFIDFLSETLNVGNSHLLKSAAGRGGQTFAHWQVGLAYAKFLSPKFHAWCNTIVRERMEGRLALPAAVDDFGPQARKVLGGIIKAVMPGMLNEALAIMLPTMVRERIASEQYAVVQGVSAGQVLEMAGVSKRKGLRGLARWVSGRLRHFHAVKGVAVHLATLGSRAAYVFDPLVCREWLANGGKAAIEQKVAERRGQGALRLV